MSDSESVSPENDFFEVEEGNNFEKEKGKIEPKENITFLSSIYKQFECCCLTYFNDLKEKDKRKAITVKRNYFDEYNKKKKNTHEFSVFNSIIKKNENLLSELPLNSKYFNPHAEWCECAHELDIELSKEEVEHCVFIFFLKMYRSETRDKELLLSVILECLYSKTDFKKEYYGSKGNFKFLKEIKHIETSNFKESLNALVNVIENMNQVKFCKNKNFNKQNGIVTDNQKMDYINNASTNNTSHFNNLNKTHAAHLFNNGSTIHEVNENLYFKLYVILKIKYSYGVYIFNFGEAYDIVVIDCNTENNNKPKIMAFYSLRKFISFLNDIHAVNYNGEDVYDSFPIIIYESKECYISSHDHLALKREVFESKKEKGKCETDRSSETSKNENETEEGDTDEEEEEEEEAGEEGEEADREEDVEEGNKEDEKQGMK